MARAYGNTITNQTSSGNYIKWRSWCDYTMGTSSATGGANVTITATGVEIVDADNPSGSRLYWTANSTQWSIIQDNTVQTSSTWPSTDWTIVSADSGSGGGGSGSSSSFIRKIQESSSGYHFANGRGASSHSVKFQLVRTSGNWTGTSTATISVTVLSLPTYSVKFTSYGSSSRTLTVYRGDSVTAPDSSITRTGYNFLGWSANSGSTSASISVGQTISNITYDRYYYGVWQVQSYKLTANSNGGNIPTSNTWTGSGTSVYKTINYGAKYDPLPNNPTRAGYGFEGWYTASSGGTQVTANTTMAAATTIYAHWGALGYTITYDYQGGTVSKANTSSYNIETATFTLTNPTRTGYNFTGWTVNTAPTAWGSGSVHDGGTTFTIGRGTYGNIKVTAKWTEKTANLTYNAAGITGSTLPSPNPQSMSYTAATTLKAATAPTGYNFLGWATSDANAKNGKNTYSGTQTYKQANVVPAAATLYATWYGTITYYANGHGTAPAAIRMYYTPAVNAAAAITATGYTFNGWNTNSGGTGTSYAAGNSVKNANAYKVNTNLYAQWTANRYDISLNNNGATSAGTTIYYQKYNTGIYSNLGCTETFPNNKITPPTRTGYTFGGYYDGSTQYIDANGTILANSTTFTSNKTLVAKWTVNSYTLTANVNIGTSISPGPTIPATSGWTIASGSKTATKQVTYNTSYGTLPDLNSNWSHHFFNGWYTASTGGTKVSATTIMGAASTTIYAQWTGETSAPTISNLIIQRCNSDGSVNDSGTSCCISFKASPGITYENTTNTSTLGPTTISISYKARNSSGNPVSIGNTIATCNTENKDYPAFVVTNSSGTPLSFVEATIYDFTITLTNGTNHKVTTVTDYLSAAYFPMDFNSTATALGIFRTAPDGAEGLYVAKPAFFENTINGFTINTDTTTLNADSAGTGIWLSKAAITNAATTNWGTLFSDKNGTPFQLFIPDSSHMYVYKRYYSNSAWSAWSKLYAGDSDKLNGLGSSASATGSTIAARNSSGYIYATYFNQSSGTENNQFSSSSNIIFANSDGFLRKTTYQNFEANIYPYEAKLQWGGQNYAGSSGPLDAAMINDLGANRFAFAKAAGITVEYSRDNGSSWTDYGLTDLQKVGLFSNGYSTSIGKADSTNKATANGTNYQLRVTLSTSTASIYTEIRKFAIYVSTNGSNGSTVTIQRALENTPTTFVDVATNISLAGWSGWNIINVSPFTTYGNTATTQNGRVRFIFKANGGNTNYTGLQVSKIQAYGGVGWTTPSTMALTGHLYSYDASQNATFPAQITATQFNGSLNGRALKLKDYTNNNDTWLDYGAPGLDSCTYLGAWNGYRLGAIKPEKLTVGSASQDGSGNTITSTYLKLSGGTLTGTLRINNLLTLYRESTTAQNYGAGISFSVKDTTTGVTDNNAYIYVYEDHASSAYGTNMVIQTGGGIFIGGGESPGAHYSAKGASYTGEDTFITTDGYVYIQANGNTIANRLGFYIDTSQNIIPCKADVATNNVGSIGTSSYKWNAMYASTFYGSLSGNATSATSATKATQDGNGANIASTYLKKADLAGKFINEAVSLDNITINANSSKADISIPAAKSGYTPIAVGGWAIDNASSSGANCSYCVPYRIRLNGTNVVASIRYNTSSNAAKIRLYVYVTYVSNS